MTPVHWLESSRWLPTSFGRSACHIRAAVARRGRWQRLGRDRSHPGAGHARSRRQCEQAGGRARWHSAQWSRDQPACVRGIAGADGIFTVSPSYAAPNPNCVGAARKLLTDSTGVPQVADSSIDLLRQELRETNALLLLILQALSGNDMVTGKDGLMPHQVPVQ